jgi:hypothetical protein
MGLYLFMYQCPENNLLWKIWFDWKPQPINLVLGLVCSYKSLWYKSCILMFAVLLPEGTHYKLMMIHWWSLKKAKNRLSCSGWSFGWNKDLMVTKKRGIAIAVQRSSSLECSASSKTTYFFSSYWSPISIELTKKAVWKLQPSFYVNHCNSCMKLQTQSIQECFWIEDCWCYQVKNYL